MWPSFSGDLGGYFYPRPPRGGRPAIVGGGVQIAEISIHALREEGDLPWQGPVSCPCYFYPRPPRGGRPAQLFQIFDVREFLSTPSARRATRRYAAACGGAEISIHALREEGDCIKPGQPPHQQDFYPRPPRGGRRGGDIIEPGAFTFLSTPSARRATLCARVCNLFKRNFYPRPPRGGRP